MFTLGDTDRTKKYKIIVTLTIRKMVVNMYIISQKGFKSF